jgi:fermentation-respiration switch protein FrsA (DUF1100 family)
VKGFILILSGILFCLNCKAVNPDTLYRAYPGSTGLAYDSVVIPTADNYHLQSWILKSLHYPDGNYLIYCGPDAGNMSYFLDVARTFVQNLDINVVLFDYRGFGKSQSFPASRDILTYPEYLTDINSVINYVDKKKNGSARIYLMGSSMGAGLSICAAAENKNIAGVFANEPYISQRQVCRNLKNSNTKISYFKDKHLEPLKMIKDNTFGKVAILHGGQDTHISTKKILKCFRKIHARSKDLYIAGNAKHGEVLGKNYYIFLNILENMILH